MINIFVTVGAQLPFDRLIKAIDLLCAESSDISVFAQTGETDYIPKHISYKKFLNAIEYSSKLVSCDLVLSHAGMGTIIQCMELNKRLLVTPRMLKYGEHRNDHQLGTAKQFACVSNKNTLLQVCENLDELDSLIRDMMKLENNSNFLSETNDTASVSLSDSVEEIIFGAT